MSITSTLMALIVNAALSTTGRDMIKDLFVQLFLQAKHTAAATDTPWDDAILDQIIAAAHEVKAQRT